VTLGPAGAPLGVFDSGLGGLTVVRALLDKLPEERIVYLGDTARVPYGTRSPETILRYARSCARELIRHDVKALVVACNTVSANALEFLRAELDLPVLGVIEPGARAAVRALENTTGKQPPGPIGVLGTASTVASGAYPRAVSQVSTRYEVLANPAPLLVPLVEEGWLDGEVPERVIQHYLEPLVAQGVSAVLLGCTHYPLLKPLIAKVAAALAGRPLPVVDSAEATADAVREWIRDERIPARSGDVEGRLRILVTDRPASFARVASRFLGEATGSVEQIDLDPT
jgi:glutamate racemase